jgi:hypothetical protein
MAMAAVRSRSLGKTATDHVIDDDNPNVSASA